MYGFRRTNCGKVTIALISKDHLVRIGTLHTGCNCRSSAVRCFDDITSKIIIGHNRTSNRYNPDGVSLNAHFIQYFADQTMHNPVPTARAEMHRHVQQCFRPFKYHCTSCKLFQFSQNFAWCRNDTAGSAKERNRNATFCCQPYIIYHLTH